MELEEYYNYLIDTCIVSDETLQVVTCINGYSVNTLNDVLYTVTSYRDIEDYLQYEDEELYSELFGGYEDEEI